MLGMVEAEGTPHPFNTHHGYTGVQLNWMFLEVPDICRS